MSKSIPRPINRFFNWSSIDKQDSKDKFDHGFYNSTFIKIRLCSFIYTFHVFVLTHAICWIIVTEIIWLAEVKIFVIPLQNKRIIDSCSTLSGKNMYFKFWVFKSKNILFYLHRLTFCLNDFCLNLTINVYMFLIL